MRSYGPLDGAEAIRLNSEPPVASMARCVAIVTWPPCEWPVSKTCPDSATPDFAATVRAARSASITDVASELTCR